MTRRETPVAVSTEGSPPRQAVASYGRCYLESPNPWSARSVRLALVLAGLAAVAVGLCWYGGSDKREPEDQVPWLLGSLLSVAVFALVGALWLIASFRTLRKGMRDFAADKRAFALSGTRAGDRSTDAASTVHAGLVVGVGMIRSHRPDCLLVTGKQVRPVELTDTNLEACGVCLP